MAVLRKTAKKKLEQLIVTAGEINADEYYVYSIDQIYVFGSYVDSDKDKLGDVDIALELSVRERYKDADLVALGRKRSEDREMSYVRRMFFTETELFKRLKGAQKTIHIGAIIRIGGCREMEEKEGFMKLCNGEYLTLLDAGASA